MYFRMLKRDLKDKIGLNISLFAFMILASILIVISTHLLYTSLVGTEKTYEICNTSDLSIVTPHSVSDREDQREGIEAFWERVPSFDNLYLHKVILSSGSSVKFLSAAGEEEACPVDVLLSTAQKDRNISYDLNDEPLEVPNGCVALAHHFLNHTHARVGDTVFITTQMGNIYAFTISGFYKEPSAYSSDQMLFSEADYEVLWKESPVKYDVYEVYLSNVEGKYVDAVLGILNDMLSDLEEFQWTASCNKVLLLTNAGLMGLIVAVVLTIVGIFMVAMILMTTHFSLKSAIKREEKEIGIMKAIGVYSLSYRALFAVKYIAFAVAGGIIGIPIAMPLGEILLNRFMIHIILPTQAMRIALAIAAVIFLILVVVLFVFFSLRSMNKISVMDSIHGENRGERFRKIPGLFLHKKKACNIPLFLALSDILGRIKRYSYLILAYACSIFMVLLIIQAKDSVCGIEYCQNHLQVNALDFYMEINDSYFSKLYEKEGSYTGVYESINEVLAANGIPARAEFFEAVNAGILFEDEKQLGYMLFGEFEYAADIKYIEGGTAPALYNEVAMGYLSAKQAGIALGDTVTLEYLKYKDDHVSYKKVQEEFVVTAYIDASASASTPVIMSEEFGGAVPGAGYYLYQYKLDCPESEYQKYYDKMDALFTDEEIIFSPKKEAFDEFQSGFISIFNLMILVTTVVAGVVLALVTALYENTFLEEETGDIAVMKSMGFDNGAIKSWHILRMLLLAALSCLAAIIFNQTLGNFAVGKLINEIIDVCAFEMITRPVPNFVIVPACVIALIALCMIPVVQAVNGIQVWRIRDE